MDFMTNEHGANRYSQSSDPLQANWFKSDYHCMYRLSAYTSMKLFYRTWQVLFFRITQDDVNDELTFIWTTWNFIIQQIQFNVSRTTKSKEYFIHHIHQILHRTIFVFSALWGNYCNLQDLFIRRITRQCQWKSQLSWTLWIEKSYAGLNKSFAKSDRSCWRVSMIFTF
jgi:hypothetical protein